MVDEETNTTFLNADWLDKHHLLELNQAKNNLKTDKSQQEFLEMNPEEQLIETIDKYPPSELKMVYMRYCVCLQHSASLETIKSTPKLKEGLKNLIWKNRNFLR